MPTHTYIRPDDERVDPGENASSFVPRLHIDNQKALRETRHVGGSWRCAAQSQAFSTHPRAWWGTAFAVPLYPGATTLNVTVALSCTVADGSVRVAIEGRESAAQTVTAGAGVTYLTFSVPSPSVQAPRDAFATIQFRSGMTAASGTTTIQGGEGNDLTISGGGSSAAPTAQHFAFRAPDADRPVGEDAQWHEGYYYAGTLYDGIVRHGYRVWPAISADSSLESGGKLAAYPLTQFLLQSYAFWLSGLDATDLVPESNVAPGLPIYSADLATLQREHAAMYEARIPIAMRDYRRGSGGCVVGALNWSVVAEQYAPSVADAVCLTLPGYGDLETRVGSPPLSMDGTSPASFPVDPGVVEDLESMGTVSTGLAVGMRKSADDTGTLVAFGIRYSPSYWGGRDLMHLSGGGGSDLDRMIPVRLSDVGRYAYLGDDNRPYATTGIYVTAAQARTVRTYTPQLLPSSTAVLPGEIVRGKTGTYDGPAEISASGFAVFQSCLRVLYSSLAPSTGFTFTASATTWIDYLVIRTSEITSITTPSETQVRATVVGKNVVVTVAVYTLAGSLVDDAVLGGLPTAAFSVATDNLTLAPATTYRVKVTVTWGSDPGLNVLAEPQLQALTLNELAS